LHEASAVFARDDRELGEQAVAEGVSGGGPLAFFGDGSPDLVPFRREALIWASERGLAEAASGVRSAVWVRLSIVWVSIAR